MKYCKECGEQCGDTDKFCWKCGAKFIIKNQPEKKTAEAKPAGKKTAAKEVKKPTSRKPSDKKTAAKKHAILKQKRKDLTYNERQMAIYAMTRQDNCGECGCKNCMMFAMQAASENNSMELNDCPYIDED